MMFIILPDRVNGLRFAVVGEVRVEDILSLQSRKVYMHVMILATGSMTFVAHCIKQAEYIHASRF